MSTAACYKVIDSVTLQICSSLRILISFYVYKKYSMFC